MPPWNLTALEQIQALFQPRTSAEFLFGLLTAREIICGRAIQPPVTATDEFAAGMRMAHELVEEHGDVEMVLLLIDDYLLRTENVNTPTR